MSEASAAWSFIHDSITAVLDLMCPIRNFKITNYRLDWMTKEFIEQVKDRDYFYAKAKRYGDVDAWNIAKFLRNACNSNKRQAKGEFFLSELKQNKNNAKKFWKVIKEAIPSDKHPSRYEVSLNNGDDRIGRKTVVNYINDYFINVGNPVAPKSDQSNCLALGSILNRLLYPG